MTELLNKLSALIIEDDPDLVHIFARALELSGYNTKTVSDGEKARAILAEEVPDIVILDLHLPGVFGGDILRTIRADGRLAQTKVILATADYRMAEDLRDTADLVLLKPISFKQLRDLSTRLSQSQQSDIPPASTS